MDASSNTAVVCMREPGNLPPAEYCICSPYDPEHPLLRGTTSRPGSAIAPISPRAAIRTPRSTSSHRLRRYWPTTQDVEVVATIQADLTEQGLKPKQHYVDAAYLSADLLVSTAQQQAIELIGPVRRQTPDLIMASQGANRLRYRPLPDRLGSPAGHLPPRTDFRQVVRQRARPHRQQPVFRSTSRR